MANKPRQAVFVERVTPAYQQSLPVTHNSLALVPARSRLYTTGPLLRPEATYWFPNYLRHLAENHSKSRILMASSTLGDTKIEELVKMPLKEPVLVQGLPGLGYVGKVAVDYFIEKLKPKKFAELYSSYLLFPDGNLGINISEDGTYSLPKYEFYSFGEKEPNAIFLTGDAQPSVTGQYEVASIVQDYAGDFVFACYAGLCVPSEEYRVRLFLAKGVELVLWKRIGPILRNINPKIPVREEKIAGIEFREFFRLKLLDKIVHCDLSNIAQTRQTLDQDRLLQFCL